VLLNSSSHDEDHSNDPWEALIRYAVNSTIDGVPLIFPGQELGLSGTVTPPNDTNSSLTAFGYDRYDAQCRAEFLRCGSAPAGVQLMWRSVPGRQYEVAAASNLSQTFTDSLRSKVRRQGPGSTRVPRVGRGVPPRRTSGDVWSGMRVARGWDVCGSSRRRDAFANTRDACAPRNFGRVPLLPIDDAHMHRAPVSRGSENGLSSAGVCGGFAALTL